LSTTKTTATTTSSATIDGNKLLKMKRHFSVADLYTAPPPFIGELFVFEEIIEKIIIFDLHPHPLAKQSSSKLSLKHFDSFFQAPQFQSQF